MVGHEVVAWGCASFLGPCAFGTSSPWSGGAWVGATGAHRGGRGLGCQCLVEVDRSTSLEPFLGGARLSPVLLASVCPRGVCGLGRLPSDSPGVADAACTPDPSLLPFCCCQDSGDMPGRVWQGGCVSGTLPPSCRGGQRHLCTHQARPVCSPAGP